MRGDARRVSVLVIAALLFVGIYSLHLLTDEPGWLISMLYLVPIALVAVEIGRGAGLAAALVAVLAVAVWDLSAEIGRELLDHLAGSVIFIATALALGTVSARARSARSGQRQLVEAAPDAVVGVDKSGKIALVNAQAERLFGYTRGELIGKPVGVLVLDEVGGREGDFIAHFFAEQGPWPSAPLDMRGRHRLGHDFPCEISLSALSTGGETMALVAIRDVTQRKRAEEELRRAFRRLEAATEIARAIGGETELDAVLDAIVERGRSLVEARGLVVMLVEGEGLVVAATAGNVDERIRGMRMPLSGVTGAAVRTLRPQRVDELKEAPLVPGREPRPGGGPAAAIVVPLEFRGTAVGVVAAFDRKDGPAFSAEDERLLLAFAASAATAVATARDVAQDRLRRTIEAAEQERKRWARELHDETLQGLGALRVALASALRSDSEEALRRVVATAVDEIAEEIRALRSLISELRPAALDELGLAAAIETLSDRSSSLSGLEMDTAVELGEGRSDEGPERLDAELESTVYRLVQEALSNVAKHARAERVRLHVRERDDVIEVLIQDDGVGFNLERTDRGFGLLGMRERVAMAGGEMEIRSSPGQGATIEARLPTRPVPRPAPHIAPAEPSAVDAG